MIILDDGEPRSVRFDEPWNDEPAENEKGRRERSVGGKRVTPAAKTVWEQQRAAPCRLAVDSGDVERGLGLVAFFALASCDACARES